MSAAPRVEHGRASVEWLALREPADARARADRLPDDLLPLLHDRMDRGAAEPLIVHDLGSGAGSQRRWLAPRLPSPQLWVEHDRDAELLTTPAETLDLASGGVTGARGARQGPKVEIRSCRCELAELTAEHLSPAGHAPAGLVTASALLDVLTKPAADRVVAAVEYLRVPLLLTLSVVGQVRLTPPDALDEAVLAAFNSHQRRPTLAGQLLGPDAVAYATQKLLESGATVRSAPSPWLLGGSSGELAAAWFTGWLDAAVEQESALVPDEAGYRARRLAEIAAGRLEVVVEHTDLLAWWP